MTSPDVHAVVGKKTATQRRDIVRSAVAALLT
jgi:hypothetical protein